MNNSLYLTFFLLFFAFSSFETTDWPLDEFIQDSEELIEKYYNQKSNDQESGPINQFKHFIPEYTDWDNKNETDAFNCYWFFIAKKRCEDPKVNATDPTCQRKGVEDYCTGCVFAHLFGHRTSKKVINNQIISMDCNNVHYHHPTIRVPSIFCEDYYISPDCHPADE